MPTKTKPSTSFKTWTQRLEDFKAGLPVRESLFSAMCSTIRRSKIGAEDTQALLEKKLAYGALGKKTFRITPEQSEKGIAWLRRRAIYKHLDPHEQKCVDDFSHFTFPGILVRERGAYGMTDARPVYRVHAKSGHWFDYVANPWQSSVWGDKEPFTVIAKQ